MQSYYPANPSLPAFPAAVYLPKNLTSSNSMNSPWASFAMPFMPAPTPALQACYYQATLEKPNQGSVEAQSLTLNSQEYNPATNKYRMPDF